jgi:phosphonate transport system permease protein
MTFNEEKLRFSPILSGLLSLLLPGLGQVIQRKTARGISIILVVATAVATTVWYGKAGWYIIPVTLWLWAIWDAIRLPKGAPMIVGALLWLGMAYGIGWEVTRINPKALFENPDRASLITNQMFRPDFLEPRTLKNTGYVNLEVPCSSAPPKADNTINDIRVTASPDCATVSDKVTVTAEGLWADTPGYIYWYTPIGGVAKTFPFTSDESGRAKVEIIVPFEALSAAPNPSGAPLMHRLTVVQTRPLGGVAISTNGKFVIQGIYETLALALLATTIGAILALPFGFLAARNLMSGNPITNGIYFIIRTILNLFRSIESLIMAIVFVVIVGLGPFPGMLAITIHTVAALGKLYSEVIEGIESGPIEAVRSTGASWMEVIRFAVIPQIIPPFTALTIYRWDINVRSSTIIGFVGGGGIGFFIYQWIIIGDYRAVSASFIAIAVVVMILDFFSARLRERLI